MPEDKTPEVQGAEELYEAVKKFAELNGMTKQEVVMSLFAAAFPEKYQFMMVSAVMETF